MPSSAAPNFEEEPKKQGGTEETRAEVVSELTAKNESRRAACGEPPEAEADFAHDSAIHAASWANTGKRKPSTSKQTSTSRAWQIRALK